MTEQEILKEFQIRAIEIINDNKDHFVQYKELMESKEYESDRETVIAIMNKYDDKKLDFIRLLGHREVGHYLGYIKLKGKNYEFYKEDFDSDDGIIAIKTILDLIGIDYECKRCISRPACKVDEHFDDCDGPMELFNNHFFHCIIKDIIDHSDYAIVNKT